LGRRPQRLNRTLLVGLGLQVVALVGLTFHDPSWVEWASVAFVMGLQALSGVAKDLTKMSSKSAVKFMAGEGALFRLVAILTGSKNALKGSASSSAPCCCRGSATTPRCGRWPR
jgi:hypothetical protein